MKLKMLLIALNLTLQLGASNKNANASASAAAAAESDSKLNASAERDTKSYASQPYTNFMHPYAIVADLSKQDKKSTDVAFIKEAIKHLSPAHQAIVMILKLPTSESEDVRKQCDEYTQGLCRRLDGTGLSCHEQLHEWYFVNRPELLRPLNERQRDVVAALNDALPQDFVQTLHPMIAGYAIDGFRYGKDVTQVCCTAYGSPDVLYWDVKGIDDLTNLDQVIPTSGNVQVTKLYFRWNPICYLPANMGSNLGNIVHFSVRHCLLESIHPRAFEGMQNLESLDLAYNNLKDIPDEIYALPKLRWINLLNNPLSEDAEKKYEAWQERRKKLQEGATASAVVDARVARPESGPANLDSSVAAAAPAKSS